MKTYPMVIALLLAFSAPAALAAAPNPELRITPTGEIHLIGVELWQRHASNLYSIRAWGLKWRMEIAYGTPLFSKYDVAVKPEAFNQGDLLEIKGKLIIKDSDYIIEPSLIRNLSIQTGEPPAPTVLSGPAPTPVVTSPTPTPPPVPALKPTTTKAKTPSGLYMYLQKGFRGGQVSMLQKFLKQQSLLGADGVSGYFGTETENALKKFQEANALEAVGTVGPKTRALINPLLAQ